jgi:Divergent InlB B-repeat domain
MRPGTTAVRRLLLAGIAAAIFVLSAPAGASAAPAPSKWCGTDESAADRLPDAVASDQVHVVYAIPADGVDRFFERALPIARDLAAIDAWWRREDPTRTLRFDLNAFPGCDSTFGSLDEAAVRLPQPGSAYASVTTSGYPALVSDLATVLTNPYKKYVVYYDGPLAAGLNACGTSSLGPLDRGASYAFVFLNGDPAGGRCGSIGGSDYMAVAAVHELMHNLGAVVDSAPHICSNGHVCDAANDLMRPFGTSNSLFDYFLDVGRDDYYGHSGTWWDVQDSGWLSHLDAPQFTLTVSESGGGPGSVASDLPGISCPPACAIAWDSGTKLSLHATPGQGRSHFAGWTGACSGTADCAVTMDAAKAIGAKFVVQSTVNVTIVGKGGSGRVVSNPRGINCPGTCNSVFDSEANVVLTATPDRRSRLLGWSLPSCAARLTCSVSATADRLLTATFGPGFYKLTTAVQGQGRVTSTPPGIACPKTCGASFAFSRSVRLSAKPAKGWRFTGWSGDCRGTTSCVVKMSKASLVRASFRRT